jgi:hypothetical protein
MLRRSRGRFCHVRHRSFRPSLKSVVGRPSLRVRQHLYACNAQTGSMTKPKSKETCLPLAGRLVAKGDQECRGGAAKDHVLIRGHLPVKRSS